MLKCIKRFGVAGIAVLALFVLLCTILYADGQRYNLRPEVRQEIRLPEHRTDAARAIDAYERTMDHYLSLTGQNLAGMNVDIKVVLSKLDSINSKVDDLSGRISKIEEALGIKAISPVEKSCAGVEETTSENRVDTVISKGLE